jgi:hypothetical protein
LTALAITCQQYTCIVVHWVTCCKGCVPIQLFCFSKIVASI